ncbi:MAG TPA: SIMPL domain-containing protein [Pseudonocardiaceae bacterium]
MAEIVTQGHGVVERVADRALLSVTFAAHGRDRKDALHQLARRVTRAEELLTDLVANGVEVTSRRLWAGRAWRWHMTNQERRRGGTARAEQSYQLRVNDLDQLDELVGRLFAAEPDTFDGPHWELSDRAEALREAQILAAQDARRRAANYAEAVGARLGPLVRLTEGTESFPTPALGVYGAPGFAGGAPESTVAAVQDLNLEPSTIRVEARCTTTWSLAES